MNWKMQSAALAHQIAENVILKCPVLLFAWYTAVHKPLVDVFSFFASRLAKFRRTEVSDFKLHRDPALLLIVFQRAGYEGKVVVEFCGELANTLLLHPAVQHFFLQRNVNLFVGIARCFTLVVKRPHERICEEDPWEAFGVQIIRHHRTIRNTPLDIEFIQNVRKILIAA